MYLQKSNMNCFVFTLNNPDKNDGFTLCDELERCCSFVIIGLETGKKGGTYHWQGYAELRKKTRESTIRAMGKWHVERRRGTQEQAIAYCKKDGNWIQHGVQNCQGRRNDLDAVRQFATVEGMRGVSAIYNLQAIRVAEKYLTYNEEPRNWKPEVIYITGPSGSGKSRKAREIVASRGLQDDLYTKNDSSKWWEGYDGHEAVIIDDFRDTWWPPTELLRLLDRYEARVEYKGGLRQLRAKLILITSIKHPQTLYRNNMECNLQFTRRVDCLIELQNHELNSVPDVPEVGGVILDAPPLSM